MNLTIEGLITLTSTLAHGAFYAGATVTPFRRELVLQRNVDGSPALDEYAIIADDAARRETLRQYAQRLLRIIWQSKSDRQWTYAQLSERVEVAARMATTLGGLVHQVAQKMDAGGHLAYYDDDAEFLSGLLSAVDANLLLYLLREPGERLLIVTRMQAESYARYEKRDLPQANGQLSLFEPPDSPQEKETEAFKVARVPYIPHVPVYSGNALRNGVVRRGGARFILDKFGWRVPLDSFRSLFVGGALVRGGDKGIDIDARRRLVGLMPLYGLLGGPFNTSAMIEGAAKTGKCWPLVREAIPVLPPSLRQEANALGMQDVMTTEVVSRREDAYRLGSDYLDTSLETNGSHAGMVVEREVLIAGTRLWSEWNLYQVTELQLGAWVSGWVKWAEAPLLGGVCQQGHGRADVAYTMNGKPFLAVEGKSPVLSDSAQDALEQYEAHLEAKKADLAGFLKATTESPAGAAKDRETDELQEAIEKSEAD